MRRRRGRRRRMACVIENENQKSEEWWTKTGVLKEVELSIVLWLEWQVIY
jgi:hypothetical protein